MRVCIIGPVHPYRGGISHYVTSLVLALRNDHEVNVLSFSKQYPAIIYPGSTDRDPSVEFYDVDAAYLINPIDPRSWGRAVDYIHRQQPDIVLFNWWVTFWAFAYRSIARRVRKRGITTKYIVHNVLPHEVRWWDKRLARLALKGGDVHILHSPQQEELLQSILPGAKTVVCPHPIYSLIDIEPLPLDTARERLSLPQDVHLFLFFGFVRPYKGLEVLLEALSILKKRELMPHVVVAGEFWQSPEGINALINDLDIQSQVHIFNEYIPNEQISNYFSAASAFVAPYIGGSQSGSLALALGFGLPAIATKEAAKGVGREEGSGLSVIPSADPLLLADEMERYISHPELLRRQSSSDEGDWGKLVDAITIVENIGN